MTLRRTAAVDEGRDALLAANASPTVEAIEGAIVAVQSEWNSWRTGMVRAAHLQNVHWAQPRGAPRPLVHAFVSCDRLQSGQIEHHCELTPPPHRLLVCVLKSHTQSSIFEALARQADAASRLRGRRQSLNADPRIPGDPGARHRLLSRLVQISAAVLRGRAPYQKSQRSP